MNLTDASFNGNLDRVRELLYSSADGEKVNLNAVDRYGQTPLYIASAEGYSEIVTELLSAGADPNITSNVGFTPLAVSSFKTGRLKMVIELLFPPDGGKGTDPNIADGDNRTPLLWASYYGRLDVVKVLIRAGADPNIANKDGRIPLYWASHDGHLEVIKVLLRAGADPSGANKYGRIPQNQAFVRGHLEVVEEFENYFPTLHTLSLRSLRRFKIDFSLIPENFILI